MEGIEGKSSAAPSSEAAGNYEIYLKIPELLSLQKPLSEPTAHDELLFIITHQTYELWFKQIIFEMEGLIATLLRNQLVPGTRLLSRISEIFSVLIHQIDVLETMSPVDFNRFRSSLNPGSGFQSVQFKELEILAGADPASYAMYIKQTPSAKNRLQNRMRGINVRSAFIQFLAMQGVMSSREEKDLPAAILKIYHHPDYQALHAFCEQLIRFDEQFSLWRFRHVQMAERMIGMKMGTGGSLGVAYLQATLSKRFFPELWSARTDMTDQPYA